MPLYGPKFPLSKGNYDTFELYDDVKQQINFFLKNLILTSPGENISDPNYGVGLRRYLFEPNTDSSRGAISSAISEQISEYLPFLILEQVSIDPSPDEIDNYSISIVIKYSLPNDEELNIFELETNQTATIGFY